MAESCHLYVPFLVRGGVLIRLADADTPSHVGTLRLLRESKELLERLEEKRKKKKKKEAEAEAEVEEGEEEEEEEEEEEGRAPPLFSSKKRKRGTSAVCGMFLVTGPPLPTSPSAGLVPTGFC